jgi:hypothetical protein
MFSEMLSGRLATLISRLRIVGVVLAVIGQVGLATAAMTLARDESSAVSHTEQSGVDLHHGHNEATCIACVALSFHAAVTLSAHAIAGGDLANARTVIPAGRPVASPQLLPNSCRAPPREA